MPERWRVEAWLRNPEGNGRGWKEIAWADDLPTAQHLFLQACATNGARLRFLHRDDGDDTVLAERSAR